MMAEQDDPHTANWAENTHTVSSAQITVERWIALFNQLPASLENDSLASLCSPDVRFIDPFHDLTGQPALLGLLRRFAHTVDNIHFAVEDVAWSSPQRCYLRWHFSGQLKGVKSLADWQFPGVSELQLDSDGKITLHRDHWDSGQYFYMKLPWIGAALRWLQRKAGQS